MRPLALAAALLLLPTATARASGPQDDARDVLAVVQRLFDAMKAKDTAAVRAVFEPRARLVGMRTRQDGTVVLQHLGVDDFVGFIGRDARGPWIERAFEPEVRVRGTLATVWASYDFHFGKEFSHCGVDAVQLLRTADGWKIVSLADTFEREGCPKREAP
jgi:ketosteroid isomerase-like protein